MNRPLIGLNSLGFKPKPTKTLKKCALCPYLGIRQHATYCSPCSSEVKDKTKRAYDLRVKYGDK